jgi:hypothetical protein
VVETTALPAALALPRLLAKLRSLLRGLRPHLRCCEAQEPAAVVAGHVALALTQLLVVALVGLLAASWLAAAVAAAAVLLLLAGVVLWMQVQKGA